MTPAATARQPAEVAAQAAHALLRTLADSGVRDVIISPGSRSTTWVLAALACPLLTCHSVIDERSAGFFALGMARWTGRPALLIATSGSAGMHYAPAVAEAAMARVPLIVLTADRPPELQHCGAPQTMDQTRLYGAFAHFMDLAVAGDKSLGAWTRKASQAFLLARSGPVHLNAPTRKPFEAQPAPLQAPSPTRAYPPRQLADPEGLAVIAADCARAERGLLVCGALSRSPSARPVSAASLAALCRSTGFALVCDAASQLRFRLGSELARLGAWDASDVLLENAAFRRGFVPDLVLQIGTFPTASAWGQVLQAFPVT